MSSLPSTYPSSPPSCEQTIHHGARTIKLLPHGDPHTLLTIHSPPSIGQCHLTLTDLNIYHIPHSSSPHHIPNNLHNPPPSVVKLSRIPVHPQCSLALLRDIRNRFTHFHNLQLILFYSGHLSQCTIYNYISSFSPGTTYHEYRSPARQPCHLPTTSPNNAPCCITYIKSLI